MKKILFTLIFFTSFYILKSQNSRFHADFEFIRKDNSWIFHVPNDERKSIFIAPRNNDQWDWWNQFIFDNKGKFTTGYVHIRPQNSTTTEGGELLLQGSSGYSDVYIDNNSGYFRIFDSNVRLQSKPGGHLEIEGAMIINGGEIQLKGKGRSTGNVFHQRALVHHWDNSDRLVINYSGDFEGGVLVEGPHLSVAGSIYSRGHIVRSLQIPPDYVFQKYYTGSSTLKSDYKMPTLQEVEEFTKKHHHLPSIPSGKEIQEKGIDLGEMSNLLLQKIEELTLYTIEQQKWLNDQQKQIDEQKNQKIILEEKLKILEEKLSQK